MPRTRISVDSKEPDNVPVTSVAEAEIPLEVVSETDVPLINESGSITETAEVKAEESTKEKVPNSDDSKSGRDPRFPHESTTDEDLRTVSGKAPFSTFLAFPRNIHFAGELAGEDIVLVLRAHLITTVPWLILSLLATLVPFVIVPLITLTGLVPSTFTNFVFFITLLWYMGVFSYAFLKVLYWYFNVGIITTERVVDVDWLTLTSHDVTTTRISKFEDVKSVRNGVLQGLFDYGTVYAQTAGEERNVEFISVAHPDLVVRKLQELMQQQEEEADG